MMIVKFITCLVLARLSFASVREIIVNEDDIKGTCTGTCETVGRVEAHPRYKGHPNFCQYVYGCTKNTKGWDRGFTSCDYCRCKCEDTRADVPAREEVVEQKWLNEDWLYGLCGGTCYRSGLVRTNAGGCKEVRNCRWAQNGWLKGFVRCDHCICDCVNFRSINKYRLDNVNYDLSEALQSPGKPIAIAQTLAQNLDRTETQSIRQIIEEQYSVSESIENTNSLTLGLAIEVTAGKDIPGVAEVSTTITTSLETGFSTTTGEVNTKSAKWSSWAQMKVPPRTQCTVKVVGTSHEIDVPYTATLVTIYDDGTEKRTETSGIYSGVDVSSFHVNFGECISVDTPGGRNPTAAEKEASAVAVASFTSPAAGCYVDNFQEANYEGVSNRYYGDVPVLSRNDDATSLRIAPGCCVKLYEHGNFRGEEFITCENKAYIGNEWNDKVSSLRVYKKQGCYVDTFQHGNYKGVSNRYYGDVHVLSRNDDATSLRIAPGCCVKLYKDGNFRGEEFITCENKAYVGNEWNDKVSSLRVYKKLG